VTDNDIQGIKLFNEQLDAAQTKYKSLTAATRSLCFNSWMSGYLFGEIARTITGDVTASTMSTAIRTVQDVETLGVMPPWTPSKPGVVLKQVSNDTGWFVKIDSNGGQVLAKPDPQPIVSAVASS
jgi:hypothetical protein